MAKLSIVIPMYNASKTIKRCLEAIYDSINQSEFKDSEVILIDDCSTDDSIKIAMKFPCRVAKLKKNSGPARARNVGVELAKGDIIVFTDSDVILEKDAIQLLGKHFKNKNTASVMGIYSKEPANESLFNWYLALNKYITWTASEELENSGFGTRLAGIRKNIFKEIGGFNTNFKEMEDFDFGHRLVRKYKLEVDRNIRGKHHFPSFKSSIKKYYIRASDWFRLFLKRRQFDNVTTTASMGITVGFGFLSILLALISLISLFVLESVFPVLIALALISLLIFLAGNFSFYLFYLKEKGFLYMIYSIVISYLIACAIGAGVVRSIITYPIDKIRGKIR